MNDERPKWMDTKVTKLFIESFMEGKKKLADSSLARMRHQGTGPKFTKRFCNRAMYRQDWVLNWIYGEDV